MLNSSEISPGSTLFPQRPLRQRSFQKSVVFADSFLILIIQYINDLTLHKQDNEKVELKYVGNRVFKAKDIIYNAEGIQELMDGFLA